jgi:hypothetical protein
MIQGTGESEITRCSKKTEKAEEIGAPGKAERSENLDVLEGLGGIQFRLRWWEVVSNFSHQLTNQF